MRKNYLTTYQDGLSTYDLHSRTVLRKCRETSRMYAWTTVTVLGCKSMHAISRCLMVVEPSPSLPQNATMLKQWGRVHTDQMDHTSEASQLLVEEVLKTLSGDTSTTWAWLKNYLLGDASENRHACA